MPLASLAAAVAAGWLARRLRVPGGAIVGALLATAAISLSVGDVFVADAVRVAFFVGLGTIIGSRVDRDSIRALPGIALQAVLAAALLILAGLGSAVLLRWLGMAPDGVLLATSPGALSVLAAAALEHGLDAPTVSLFHIVRIVLILVTLPLLVVLLPGNRARRSGPATVSGADDGAIPGVPEPTGRPFVPPGPTRPGAADLGWLAATMAGAAAGAYLATLAGIPGPLIFGTVSGAAIVTLCAHRPTYRPSWLSFVIQSGLGWIIGSLVTRSTLVALGDAVVPALLSSVLIIAAGILIALGFRMAGIAPEGDVLATSPGAVEALASVADEQDAGPLQVTVFHTMRLIFVLASLPVLLQWS